MVLQVTLAQIYSTRNDYNKHQTYCQPESTLEKCDTKFNPTLNRVDFTQRPIQLSMMSATAKVEAVTTRR